MQKPLFFNLTKPIFVLLITCTFFCLHTAVDAQNPNPSLSQIRNMTPDQQRSSVIKARKNGYTLLQLERQRAIGLEQRLKEEHERAQQIQKLIENGQQQEQR